MKNYVSIMRGQIAFYVRFNDFAIISKPSLSVDLCTDAPTIHSCQNWAAPYFPLLLSSFLLLQVSAHSYITAYLLWLRCIRPHVCKCTVTYNPDRYNNIHERQNIRFFFFVPISHRAVILRSRFYFFQFSRAFTLTFIFDFCNLLWHLNVPNGVSSIITVAKK